METCKTERKYYYKDVPGLGNVAVSRHAQFRMDEQGIPETSFERALLTPVGGDTPDGIGIRWRERDGVRLVIMERPEPWRGAMLVKTVHRVLAAFELKGKA